MIILKTSRSSKKIFGTCCSWHHWETGWGFWQAIAEEVFFFVVVGVFKCQVLIIIINFILHMWVFCQHVYLCIMHAQNPWRAEEISDALELELQIVVSYKVDCRNQIGIKSGVSGRAASALTAEPCLQFSISSIKTKFIKILNFF